MIQYQTICLCMIVKNEANVIRRCIDSVRPFITHWIIVDTGSSDGTQEIVRDYLRDLPGALHERPWRDFAHNRSEALALARPLADYSLIIDADDTLEIPEGFNMGPLTSDCYTMDIRDPPQLYPRIQLVSNRLAWRYRGVLHEFVTTDGPYTSGTLPIAMRRNHDGARRKESAWFIRDAEILERALKTEADGMLRARYTFYLAQSYRDAGQLEQALRCYLERARMGGWEEEVYVSLYQAAKLKERLQHPDQDVITAYEAATAVLPSRVEAAHGAARFCRLKGHYRQGYEIAKRNLGKPLHQGSLFGEPWIYETGLLDEFAVNAYWAGHHGDCLNASLKVLASGALLDQAETKRVINNAQEAWTVLSRLGSYARPALAILPEDGTQHVVRSSVSGGRRVAVITPYAEADLPMLKTCHESVLAQEADVTHILIACGTGSAEAQGFKARHVVLPDAVEDNGKTARGIGSLLAAAEGYDFIAFLDARNWFRTDHLSSLLALHEKTGADVCCSLRSFHHLDGSELQGVSELPEVQMLHVDTSCYLLHRTAFAVTDTWTKMPRALAGIGDRVFLASIRERGFTMAFSGLPTVAFRSPYRSHYLAAGITPPEGARDGSGTAEREWLSTPEGIRTTVRALGFYP